MRNLGKESASGKGHAVSPSTSIISSGVKVSIVCCQTVMQSLLMQNMMWKLDMQYIISLNGEQLGPLVKEKGKVRDTFQYKVSVYDSNCLGKH